jgi:hypothetical protein
MALGMIRTGSTIELTASAATGLTAVATDRFPARLDQRRRNSE